MLGCLFSFYNYLIINTPYPPFKGGIATQKRHFDTFGAASLVLLENLFDIQIQLQAGDAFFIKTFDLQKVIKRFDSTEF